MSKAFKIVLATVFSDVSMEQFNKVVATYGDGDAQAAQIAKWKAEGWYFVDEKGNDVVSRSAATAFRFPNKRAQIVPEDYTGADMPDLDGLDAETLRSLLTEHISTNNAKEVAYCLNNGERLYRKAGIQNKPKGTSEAAELRSLAALQQKFFLANAANPGKVAEFAAAAASGTVKDYLETWAKTAA